jgi:hypothetical protein
MPYCYIFFGRSSINCGSKDMLTVRLVGIILQGSFRRPGKFMVKYWNSKKIAAWLYCYNTIFNSIHYQAHPGFDVQFFKQRIPVTVNGTRTYKHFIGNFFIGHFGAGVF